MMTPLRATCNEGVAAHPKQEILQDCPLFSFRDGLDALPKRRSWTNISFGEVKIIFFPALELEPTARHEL